MEPAPVLFRSAGRRRVSLQPGRERLRARGDNPAIPATAPPGVDQRAHVRRKLRFGLCWRQSLVPWGVRWLLLNEIGAMGHDMLER